MIINKQILLVLTTLWGFLSAYPQNNSTMMNFSFRLSSKHNNSVFNKYWQSSPSLGLNLSIEENFGFLGGGVDITKFNKKTSTTTDFWGVGYFLLYRYSFDINKKVSLIPEINIGLFEFWLKDINPTFTNDAGNIEREFFVKYLLGLSYSLKDNLNIELLTSYQKIYTQKQIDFLSVETSIKYIFNSPEWLGEYLK